MTVEGVIAFRIPGPARRTKNGRGFDSELVERILCRSESQWIFAEDLLRKIGAQYSGSHRISGRVRMLAKNLGYHLKHDYGYHDGKGLSLRVKVLPLDR